LYLTSGKGFFCEIDFQTQVFITCIILSEEAHLKPRFEKLKGLSVFFPCHNEEQNIPALLESAQNVLPALAEEFEIIVVDDGSQDQTATIVEDGRRRDARIRLVRHPHNLGYGAALKSGFQAARLPWVFFTDADGQFDLEDLKTLIEASNNAEIVSGYRLHRADPWYRLLNAAIYSFSLRLFMGLSVPDVNCAFKLYQRDIFNRFPLKTNGALINAEILCRAKLAGCLITWLPVTHYPRKAGVPTGAKPAVLLKAMAEFWMLFLDLLTIRLGFTK
jgi:glycosyltransferase involved in cell wall biosynthesis